jgi:hypothetical protein
VSRSGDRDRAEATPTRRTAVALTLVSGLVMLSAGLGPPDNAGAATTTVRAPGLSITVPAAVNLGSTAPGGTISAKLGPVTVDDSSALSAWTATVSTTDFTTGSGLPALTITRSHVSYWSGPATASSGVQTLTPGQPTATQAKSLTSPATAFSMHLGVLASTATWNPTLVISVPSAAVGGIYSGTVTHSVA